MTHEHHFVPIRSGPVGGFIRVCAAAFSLGMSEYEEPTHICTGCGEKR